jgi:hypothetical protein
VGARCESFIAERTDGTRGARRTYSRASAEQDAMRGRSRRVEVIEMKDVLRIVGIVFLALFVLVVVMPLVLAVVGVAVGGIITLAVLLIKLAVVLAIGYLILVGIRAVMR